MAEALEEQAVDDDLRLVYIHSFLSKSVKFKVDKWHKMMGADEYNALILDFLNNSTHKILLFSLTNAGALIPAVSFPVVSKTKVTYFIRALEEAITPQNFHSVIICGDISARPLDALAVLFEQIYIPILSNGAIQKRWPTAVRDDMKKHIYDLKSAVFQVGGLLSGRTLLALPDDADRVYDVERNIINSGGEAVDLHFKTSIEGTVIKWASQINEVLKDHATSLSANASSVAEFQKWSNRLQNLESIYFQLNDPRIKAMTSILKLTNSAYLPCFKSLFKSVIAAVHEANEVNICMKVLVLQVNRFDEVEDFLEAEKLLPAIMHTLCLIWAHCKYFTSSSKLINILSLICNMLITKARKYINPSKIFQIELEETAPAIVKTIHVLNNFKKLFDFCRQNLYSYFPKGEKSVPWLFDKEAVFKRFNIFIHRMQKLEALFSTAIEYSKLEKIELGGILGRYLSGKVSKMHTEFQLIIRQFQQVTYDPTDIDDESFVKDYANFTERVVDIDRRLASILNQAVMDCHNLQQFLKLIYVVGSLLERPIIHKEVSPKCERVIDMLSEELDACSDIFNEQMDSFLSTGQMQVDLNWPPIAGRLQWIIKLRSRLQTSISKYKEWDSQIVKLEESSDALKKYDIMMGKLDQLEDETISKWVAEISNTISQNLSKTLFAIHADTKLLSINYSCELIAAVREIRYLLLLETYSIPDLAIQFYSKNNEFILLIFTLDQIIQWYNLLRESSRPEEFNLIEHQIKEIDTIIDYSQEVLTWNSQDAHLTIEKIKTLVYRLYLRVSKAQRNIKEIIRLSSQWNSRPLYCRKNNKKDALLSLENRGEKLQKRYHEIRKASSEIYKLTKENFYLYFKGGTENVGENGDTIGNLESPSNKVVDEKKFSFDEDDLLSNKKKRNLESQNHHETNNSDSSSPESAQGFEWSEVDDDAESRQKWDNYIHYVDSIVLEGLIKAVNCSIGYLEEQMVCSSEKAPLMEISLELTEPLITFQPSLDLQDPEGLFCLVVNLIDEIQAMSEYAHQISTQKQGQSFREDIEGNDDISFFISSILSETENVINEAVKFANTFEQYNYLWLGDRFEYLNQFLKYGKPLTAEEEEMIGKSDEDGQIIIKESSPRLDDYKAQIDMYEEIYKEVDQIPSSKVFFNWFRVDIRPFKQALLNNICKWSMLFKRHLMDYVVYNLADLADFINKSDVNLNHGFLLQEGDYDGLVHVMGCLLKVKERQIMTDIMFTPFQEIIEFLKNYDLDFPEEIFVQLQDLPDQWINTKKLALSVKAAISPLVQREANTIKKRIILFDIRQMLYKELFKDYEFFNWTCKEPYAEIDNIHLEIKNLEEMTCRLSEQAVLFEVSCPEFKFVPVVRKELKLLKILWDYIIIIRSWFRDWEDTHWTKIDSEAMDMELKKFSKELRSLDKDMRNWEIYLQLEAMIKNMITALKAVAELQNPAIRERHWQQLMAATKVKFMIDESTTLADLLALHLYKYEEEVKTIVDKSVKEQSMEKILNELKQIWGMMEFTYEINERTNCWLLKCSEDTIEILEEHQVQLQNMMSSKFVEYFQQEVSEWQRKLGKVDQVVNLWLEVQRTWIHLESIFIGSEDIRRQLPHDSARFDATDQEFKTMLCDIHKIPNMVNACNRPNLVETLEKVQLELTKCEKALAQYLESKRCIYPRFYFISSADLLDILSNSDNPEAVCRHLTKLYDSIAKIKFREDSDPRKRKIAKGMFAKDGEYVEFSEDCDCNGQVEKWLNNVTDVMRKTGRHYFAEAVLTYDEKPREQWIFDYPAQSALCGTQIWWTTEVELAFARLEEGYENALKDYNKKQIIQLNTLISLLLGDLTTGDRQKIMTICTIDVHARDVICKLVNARVESSAAFQWQSQLRHRWDKVEWDCFANICDAEFRYDYEYLGNTPRLVTTPLTDRCYITLSQSLHLIMGGAPAGPAGTGKTETTKDLGKAIGIMVYVFNCSEQMDYKSVGNIYKGLAQTGAWGCFDEFNRISVEVLSVVAVQVKTVLDAIKGKKSIFNFLGETIRLVPTVGMFITMNPGYAGRAELPENLKALFRPCAMVVPDFELICEIMLVAEGFQEARMLARKFITLYSLCKELLSNQDHYDWGLRAIKSVLVVAGSLKRGDRMRPEEQVLMRALRDFNIPKIVTDDMPIFMGLISDLFPSLEIPRMKDLDFEKQVRNAALSLKLQPEDSFILKVVQLVELFAVRHSVFIIGSAGTGKSEVWKTLFKTYQNMKLKPHYNDLEPKAVTNDELFGIINPATREWKDGLFSVLLRDQALMTGDGPKWMVMDGDIDPMWIESLNTVMDDNKVLTLASNERIALTPEMRLLFEISNLKTATPATVSRAGILYINPQDLGWNPYMTSWLENRRDDTEKGTVLILFDKYVPPVLEMLRTKCKQITPIPEITHVQMLCSLLDALLVPSNVPSDSPKEWYETYFVFACVWAFGSACFQDQLIDWRAEFSKWWVNEFKAIKFPPAGSVFNYYIDPETKKFVPWAEKVDKFELDPEIPLQASLVPTAETVRLKFFLNLFIQMRKPVMLVGPGGSGKSIIVNEKLSCLSENFAHLNVPLNFYTTSEMLQKVLEKSLEKKAGRNYGPPGNKFMIYFIDDLNMPEVDQHGTVQPHTLIRQWMNYQHWYDRSKLTLKDIHNIMFLACMNPSAGSFTIDPRLQRHFFVFATNFPCSEELHYIYSSVLNQHLNNHHLKFPVSVIRHGDLIIQLALMMHAKMATTFLPTAIKFHYTFNLRDLTNVFQGIMFANGDCVPTPGMFVRLWMHETCRVYGDKLVDTRDQDNFNKLLVENIKKVFQELPESEYLEKPLIYCHFVEGLGDPKYMPVTNWSHLNKLLTDAMAQYNDLVSAMNLVLFEDAMSHICRINRIMESPRGNVLLVGVGGSGKQSLARLSAFISGLESFQIQLKKGYNISDMKIDLANLYLKTGLKNVGIMLLMTDSQIIDEKFLVLINDMLASGEILDLFSDEEVDHIISAIKPEVKGTGLVDSREMCWKFFIDRVRKLLKIILCFSPVGPSLRIRARRFPAIVNCTSINWFYEWPQEALESVSKRFLSEIEELPGNLVVSASSFMAFVHTSVNKVSVSYFQNEKRFNYTTPKSFLEQILLYRKLLKSSTIKINDGIQRFQTGLQKLLNCALQVDGLQKELAVKEIELMEKNSKAEELIKVVGKEQLKVADEKQFVAEEERKVRIIEEDVSMKQRCCEEDLERAEPALVAAQAALDTLNKNNLTELKSFGSPPPAVANVTAGVMVLFAAKGKLPKDRSWKACKLMMAKLDAFLDALLHYDKENVHPDVVKGIQPYLKDPEFDPDAVRSKSTAAAGLCAWVINIMKFHDVWVVVEPKRRALVAANSELAAARNKLAELKLRISALEAKLQDLTNKFETAVNEKLVCQAQADECSEKIDLANRLVNGLASENVRWRESVTTFQMNAFTLPGDVLLVTAFISYVGCFTRPYREKLLNSHWLPFLKKLKPEIPLTNFVEPLNILADSATIASWNNEGLPNDRMSAENAVIVVNSEKWPLLIDPQLQGIKWIKNKYGERLSVVRLGHDQTMDILEECLRDGRPLLIENIGESLDPILSNLIARNLIHRGRAVRVGEKEMVFNPDFRLILHTKLANPHYKPELQAQTTLINFTVTHKGLEEQLLAEVVKAERPDLEESKSGLTKQQNNFKIALKQLEDELLWRLSSAGGEVLSDKNLVLNLEQSKLMAKDIEVQVVEAKLTSAEIDKAREKYRTAATRASIIYFIMSDLYKINPIYQFSLKAFSVVFHKAILTAEPSADIQERVTNLIDNITFMIFMYTCRGLFESDKLIFLAQMTIQILAVADEIKADELDFVLRFPFVTGLTSPVDFLTNQLWGGIKALAMMDDFRGLDKDIEGAAKRWKKFIEGECPERDKLPQEWKGKSSLQRLCIMRSIRPDRMTYAVQCFIEEKLGAKFVEARSVEFEKSFQEASAIIPIFFILSPGVDPTRDVERVGKRMGFTADGRNFHNVSLGQGQEGIAEEALELSAKVGHWLILQNVHLVKNWLPILDKKMEKSFENPHPDYRLFISAEPSPDPEFHVIPQGILESSIKITNEPPTGMLANLHKALDNFNQNTLEMCSKEGEFKAILFSLCYFHACIAERKKFGPQGWNRSYPFNVGDLTISVHVLYNYLEANSKVPWEDLRYLFGEIMYGGHVTDDWDRRLCRTYLEEFMSPHLMEGDKYFAPGFPAPPNTDYIGYHNYIDDMLPQESPTLYGLHPNAEIGFLTMKAEHLFKTLLELQPRESTTSVTGIISREDKVRQVLDEILDKVPDEFNIPDMISKIEDKTPFTVVAVQECERMNLLMREIRRSLKELSLGLKGELSVTGVMESLETALFLDLVPSEWVKLAYPSMLNLGCWFQDLMIRLKELEAWISDFGLPSTIWLSGFFNPQSFLTAIMQTAARKNEWPLDKMCLLCDVTKKTREDFTAPPREGAYVSGLFMEGARWDMATGTIAESRLKELVPAMPVIYVKAVIEDKHEIPNLYECPIYKTRMRGPTYVWTFNLKTREKPAKWILAGVALLLSA